MKDPVPDLVAIPSCKGQEHQGFSIGWVKREGVLARVVGFNKAIASPDMWKRGVVEVLLGGRGGAVDKWLAPLWQQQQA